MLGVPRRNCERIECEAYKIVGLPNLKILALIAARGGSKRVPGKNIRLLGDKPLIVWSIDFAKEIHQLCDVMVSTDHSDIADIALQANALVPWLRPAELATDDALSVDVCLHALNWYEREKGSVDGLLLLQPTSPFRRHDTILRGIELFRAHRDRSIVGVSPAKSHPMWCLQVRGDAIRPFIEGGGIHLKSQDLPAAYVLNGSFYVIAPNLLRQQRTFVSDSTLPLIMDAPEEAIDIDTEWDWRTAQMFLAHCQAIVR
jgi:CMP-N,N'-diacetyllegionaminic acid synthase